MATEELRAALREEYLLSTGLDSFDKDNNDDNANILLGNMNYLK